MNASELRELVGFFRMVETPDGQGGYIQTLPEVLVADTPAKVEPASEREQAQFHDIGDRKAFIVHVRYREDIETADRIVWAARAGEVLLNIDGIRDVDSRGAWLRIQAVQFNEGDQ